MRILLVGFGVAAKARLATYRGGTEDQLVGVVDTAPARRAAAERLGLRTFDNIGRACEAVGPDIVDICTPPALHATHTIEALRHGCHVICEKPAFLSVADADAVSELAEARGLVLYPAHNYLFSPHLRLMENYLTDGRIGRPTGGELQVLRTGPAPGVADWRPGWRLERAFAGGGILIDHGTHMIYLIRWLMGERVPTAVSCAVSGPANGAGLEVEVELRLDYPDAQWWVQLSWRAPSRQTRYRLNGPLGSIEVLESQVTVTEPAGSTTVSLDDDPHDRSHSAWFPAMFEDFRQAVAGGRCRVTLAQARDVAAVLSAAQLSAKAGRPVAPVELARTPTGSQASRP